MSRNWCDVVRLAANSLAIGIEKLASPDRPERIGEIFDTAIEQLEPQRWRDYYAAAGAAASKRFEIGAGRTLYMDTYAMQAAWHMRRSGTTQRQIAAGCAKNHSLSTLRVELQRHESSLPRFVLTELQDYLRCGRLEYGFVRVKCNGCRQEHLVAGGSHANRLADCEAISRRSRLFRSARPSMGAQLPLASASAVRKPAR